MRWELCQLSHSLSTNLVYNESLLKWYTTVERPYPTPSLVVRLARRSPPQKSSSWGKTQRGFLIHIIKAVTFRVVVAILIIIKASRERLFGSNIPHRYSSPYEVVSGGGGLLL
jgi:hypothetical protein